MQQVQEDIVALVKALGKAVKDLPASVQEKAFDRLVDYHLGPGGGDPKQSTAAEKPEPGKAKKEPKKRTRKLGAEYNLENVRPDVKNLRISTKTKGVIEYSSAWKKPRKALWVIAAAQVSGIESLRDHELAYLLKKMHVSIKSDNMASKLGTWEKNGLVCREDVEEMAGWALTEEGIQEFVREDE